MGTFDFWSPDAEEVVQRLINRISTQPSNPKRNDVIRFNALPIGSSMWAEYYLKPCGTVLIIGQDYNAPNAETISTDHVQLLSALFGGSKLYPELRELLPHREPGANDCDCLKYPHIFGPEKVICPSCGGLGWLPPSLD